MPLFRDLRSVFHQVWSHPANRGRQTSAITRAVRFQIRSRITRRPSRVAIGGATILAERGFKGSTKAVYGNPPDWAEMQAWRRILKPGDLFVDVGANVGAYTLWAIDCGAKVIAVEPHAETAGRFRRNIQLNSYEVEFAEVALADKPGLLRMTSNLDAMNHLILDDQGGVEVPVTTLDLLLGDRAVAGMKIDVEGAEELVLRGAVSALAERRLGVIQLEWNDLSQSTAMSSRQGLAELLRNAGYRFTRPDEDGTLVGCDPTGYGADVFAVLDCVENSGE
jgi:FkbM family methyltransferase